MEGKGYVVKGKDKFENEIEIPLAEFAKTWLEANPELAKATVIPGSGTPKSGSPATGAPGPKRIPRTQWEDMEWFAANSEKFRKGEYVRDYDS